MADVKVTTLSTTASSLQLDAGIHAAAPVLPEGVPSPAEALAIAEGKFQALPIARALAQVEARRRDFVKRQAAAGQKLDQLRAELREALRSDRPAERIHPQLFAATQEQEQLAQLIDQADEEYADIADEAESEWLEVLDEAYQDMHEQAAAARQAIAGRLEALLAEVAPALVALHGVMDLPREMFVERARAFLPAHEDVAAPS